MLSVRVPDEQRAEVERRRIDQGMSLTDWLRWAVDRALADAPPAPEPDPAAVQFCLHPAGKRVGAYCVACGHNVDQSRA